MSSEFRKNLNDLFCGICQPKQDGTDGTFTQQQLQSRTLRGTTTNNNTNIHYSSILRDSSSLAFDPKV